MLLQRHFRSLYRFFRNKVGPDADDLIQATMLAIVKGRDGFREECSFRAYLFIVARHELYRFLRREAPPHEAFDPATASILDARPTPSRVAGARAEQALLLDALRSIPVDFQTALELHYWEGLSMTELADALEIPVGTAKTRGIDDHPIGDDPVSVYEIESSLLHQRAHRPPSRQGVKRRHRSRLPTDGLVLVQAPAVPENFAV